MSVEIQMAYYISVENYDRKTTNSFGISRASVSAIIKRVLYAITTFSEPKPMDFRTTENKVK